MIFCLSLFFFNFSKCLYILIIRAPFYEFSKELLKFYFCNNGKIPHPLQSILITAVSLFFIHSEWDMSS